MLSVFEADNLKVFRRAPTYLCGITVPKWSTKFSFQEGKKLWWRLWVVSFTGKKTLQRRSHLLSKLFTLWIFPISLSCIGLFMFLSLLQTLSHVVVLKRCFQYSNFTPRTYYLHLPATSFSAYVTSWLYNGDLSLFSLTLMSFQSACRFAFHHLFLVVLVSIGRQSA